MEIERYGAQHEALWNDFVRRSKNGTFLFDRSYMDYHADRFEDFSLIVREDEQVIAVLPASRLGEELVSHGGLTYGGFVSTAEMTATRMLDVLGAVLDHVGGAGIEKVVYKCVPHMYHIVPAEEDTYALFRRGARLVRRDLSSAIDVRRALPYGRRRQRALRTAVRRGQRVEESTDYARFWPLLEQNLHERHLRRPVHTLDEIERLARAFPRNIRLFRTICGDETTAGVVVYLSANVCHVQYNAASEEGRRRGAQDLALATVIGRFAPSHRWVDLGISTEHDGWHLNEGLVDYKEGFGARSVNYDTYELTR